MKTEILYEDKDILVCYKPPGIAVQTASVGQQDMVSELKNYLVQAESMPKGAGIGKEPYIGVVHRLDQPVSGVLVFAKNPAAAAFLSARIQDGSSGKIYRALVLGGFGDEAKEGVLENILIKDAKTNTSRVVKPDSREVKQGKKAKLSYLVLNEYSAEGVTYSEVEITLFTGRHHQIRVQMSNAGHPILGDTKYGTPEAAELSFGVGRGLKLCAYRLSFMHPSTKKEMSFTAPILPWKEK